MIKKAEKTLALIDSVIAADQGAGFRQALRSILPKMEDAYRADDDPFRRHLGASMIGKDCSRALFYNFYWCKVETHEPRILRLFNRGHLEEARFLAMLKILEPHGVQFWFEKEGGGQYQISDHGGHFGSSLDGVALGIPDVPAGQAVYTEFKTSAEKGFNKLVKEGMRSAKYEHFIQCQICMAKAGLNYSLYMVVNKNNDELYAEIIEYEPEIAKRYLTRAKNIIFTRTLPEPISYSDTWYECRFCTFKDICKNGGKVHHNCRTCQYSMPTKQGEWHCLISDDKKEQRQKFINNKQTAMIGCQDYKLKSILRK